MEADIKRLNIHVMFLCYISIFEALYACKYSHSLSELVNPALVNL